MVNNKRWEEMKLYVGEEMRCKIIILSNYHPVEEIINVFNVGVLATDTDYHMEGISNSIMEYIVWKWKKGYFKQLYIFKKSR